MYKVIDRLFSTEVAKADTIEQAEEIKQTMEQEDRNEGMFANGLYDIVKISMEE